MDQVSGPVVAAGRWDPRADEPDAAGGFVAMDLTLEATAARLASATLRHRGELEDFVYDNFPEVYRGFWERMSLETGVRILVDGVDPHRLVSALARHYPLRVEQEAKRLGATGLESPSSEARFKV